MDAWFVRGHRTIIGLIRGVARTGWRPRQLRCSIGWVARMKGVDRLIYAVVGTRRGGGGGGGVKCEVPRTRCSTGVRLWGVLFGVRLSGMLVQPIGTI